MDLTKAYVYVVIIDRCKGAVLVRGTLFILLICRGAGGPAGCTRCRTFFSLPGTSREPPWNSEVRERAALFAVGIWVSYVTSCYVTSCSVCPGSSVALGGGGGGQFFFSIRKQHSVDKVHTLRYSVTKIS